MKNLFFISISGLSGIWLRYFLILGFERISSYAWLGILLINILGSFIAGIIFEISVERELISSQIATILLVGFCGGFTTFSSYSVQSQQMIQNAQYGHFLFYFILSPVLGLAAAYAGLHLAKIFI